MNDFLKANGVTLVANLLTVAVVLVAVSVFLGGVSANVEHLQAGMLNTESRDVAETRDESIIREISVLREGIWEGFGRLESKIDGDILRLESKIDKLSELILQSQ